MEKKKTLIDMRKKIKKVKEDCACLKLRKRLNGGELGEPSSYKYPACCPCGEVVHRQVLGHCWVCGGTACTTCYENAVGEKPLEK